MVHMTNFTQTLALVIASSLAACGVDGPLPSIGDNDPAFEISVDVPVDQLEDGTGGRIVDGGLEWGQSGGAVTFLIRLPSRYHITGVDMTAKSTTGTKFNMYSYAYVGSDSIAKPTSDRAITIDDFNGPVHIDIDVSHPPGELLNTSRIMIARYYLGPLGNVWVSDVSLTAQLEY